MKIWIDAQLPPALASWLTSTFHLEASAVRDLNFRNATDREIFFAAKEADAVVLSKDSDFLQLLDAHGPPPKILWITCGNTSNTHLKQILSSALSPAIDSLQAGESLVEITDLD